MFRKSSYTCKECKEKIFYMKVGVEKIDKNELCPKCDNKESE